MNTKNNQRFQQTEQRLEEVFLALCQDSSPEKVTVTQLCQRTGINRSTFYDHFLDVPDLIYKTGVRYIKDICAIMGDGRLPSDFSEAGRYLADLLSYISTHTQFFHIFLNLNRQDALDAGLSPLWEPMERCFLDTIGKDDPEKTRYQAAFFKAGFIALLRRWLLFGCRESPEQIVGIVTGNLSGIMRWDIDAAAVSND